VSGTLFLGTSGYSYDEWKHDVFYPEGLKNREMLSYYSRQLNSVEINYTFRRFPSEKTIETWRAETPEGFRFALKASQRITHFKRLADADDDVRSFLERAAMLRERLAWEPYGFLRLRKTSYADEELAGWADRIRDALAAGGDVFCYFKHEDLGASPQMAKRLEDILGSRA
jgi:uncharacterized protein YecE (DUF72 family)